MGLMKNNHRLLLLLSTSTSNANITPQETPKSQTPQQRVQSSKKVVEGFLRHDEWHKMKEENRSTKDKIYDFLHRVSISLSFTC